MNEYKITQVERFIRVLLKLGIDLHEIGFTKEEIHEMYTVAKKAIIRIVFE